MKIIRTLLGCLLAAAAFNAAHAADEQTLERGKKVFNQWCVACHGTGVDKPGTHALGAKYERKLVALDQGPPVDPKLLAFFVRNGISIMPPFRKTEITDADLADLAAYVARPR